MPMNRFMQGMLFALLLVYVVSPVDFVPGPVDDILAIVLYAAANRNKFLPRKSTDNDRIEVIDVDGREI
ncbi:hypothetical protein bpr_I0682 [Butyrivibrio proteoclasticus B316]|uniref:DUF1232 domain-containing protein n=2 Tax=Lachnospiraceae TaxID=186803 RepID=E0S0V2_BUTPB|nr:hypothetical protein bpr_I0682 [Butyrivibrio proteoclasticus B316]